MEKMAPSPVKLKDQQAKDFAESSIKKVEDSMKEGGEPAIFEGKNMNGFFRKVLFNNVASLFPTSLFQSVGGMERNVEVIHFTSEEEKCKYLDTSWEEELSNQLGFGHIVKAILESNKPLVGHNMILDLLHFVDKFITPLPPSLSQFKTVVKANLPTIYDTKVLARDPPFSANIINTALGRLYEELTSGYSPPSFGVEKGHQSYSISEDGQAHDGGFDAFMTGVAFITMLKTLEGKRWGKAPYLKAKSLQKYSNKINFMGSYDIPFIDLEKSDVIPDRGYIFNVTCPSTWTFMNVRHAFACLKSYKTVWVNDTRLFVIPQDDCGIASSKKLLPKIRAACSPNVHVELFEQKMAGGVLEDGHKQNGKHSSGKKRAVKDDTVPSRPSSISLKRTSDTAKKCNSPEATRVSASDDDVGGDASRSLKRLKSVGSDLLSSMTLESPMSVDKGIPEGVDDQSDLEPPPPPPPSAPPTRVEEFPVPDE
ncbi:Poly(A)-specific ribonuclease PARN, partial [Armadillidium nasatum]